jgi:hypothetical protein
MIRIFQTGFIVPLFWLTLFGVCKIRYLVCGGATILVRFADNDCCPWNSPVGQSMNDWVVAEGHGLPQRDRYTKSLRRASQEIETF